ncbi:6154_t:CDS:2, partial [Cetraspora pellucida]
AVRRFQPHSSFIGDREAEPVHIHQKRLKQQSHFCAIALELLKSRKVFEITHTNAVANMAQISSTGYFSTRNIIIGILLAIVRENYLFVNALMISITFKGCFRSLLPGFNLMTFCRCVQKYKVNFIHTVPPNILALVRSPSVESMSSVEFVFSGAAENWCKDLYNIYKIPVRQGYGLAEPSALISICEKENIVSGSSGVLLNLEARLLSEEWRAW